MRTSSFFTRWSSAAVAVMNSGPSFSAASALPARASAKVSERVMTALPAPRPPVPLISGTNGWPLGGIASAEEETIVYGDLDIVAARSALIWNDLNDLARDRRTDLYDGQLGYRHGALLPR